MKKQNTQTLKISQIYYDSLGDNNKSMILREQKLIITKYYSITVIFINDEM